MSKSFTPICSRCEEPLQLSDAALKAMERLAKTGRPTTCAKCAVDHKGSTSGAKK